MHRNEKFDSPALILLYFSKFDRRFVFLANSDGCSCTRL